MLTFILTAIINIKQEILLKRIWVDNNCEKINISSKLEDKLPTLFLQMSLFSLKTEF